MRPVDAGLQLDRRQLRLGVGLQQQIDILRGQRCAGGVAAEVDARRLVPAASEEREALVAKDAHGVRAHRAAHDLRAVYTLEREEVSAHVVEHLDGVAVDRVYLVAQFEQRDHWVGIDLRRSVLERVDGKRVAEFGDHQKLAVRGHEVAIDPHDIKHRAEVGVGDLRQRRAVPVVQAPAAGDGQTVKGVVEGDVLARWPAHITQHRDSAASRHADQLRAHHPVAHATPVDAATVGTVFGAGEHYDAIVRAQVLL